MSEAGWDGCRVLGAEVMYEELVIIGVKVRFPSLLLNTLDEPARVI